METPFRAAIACVLILLAWEPRAFAMEGELAGGYTFDRYHTLYDSGVASARLITQTDSWLPTEWTLGYIFGQDKNPSNHWNNDIPVTYVAVGKRVEWKFLIGGFGFAVIDKTNQRISTIFNFKSQAGLKFALFRDWQLIALVQHISNAGTGGENDGETFYDVGLRARF